MIDIREILNAIKPYVLGWTFQNGIWAPTYTGFSADPTAITRYTLQGNLCTLFVYMSANGTSNTTSFTMTAPFIAADVSGNYWGAAWWTAVDNGATLTAPGRVFIQTGSNVITIAKDMASGVWTGSGGKRADFVLPYEIN